MGRAIDEDAVTALINLKVKALEEKLAESFTPDSTDERKWKAQISAMNAVKMHLKHIEPYKFPAPRPLHELFEEDEAAKVAAVQIEDEAALRAK